MYSLKRIVLVVWRLLIFGAVASGFGFLVGGAFQHSDVMSLTAWALIGSGAVMLIVYVVYEYCGGNSNLMSRR